MFALFTSDFVSRTIYFCFIGGCLSVARTLRFSSRVIFFSFYVIFTPMRDAFLLFNQTLLFEVARAYICSSFKLTVARAYI